MKSGLLFFEILHRFPNDWNHVVSEDHEQNLQRKSSLHSVEPPESAAISRKSTKVLGPIPRVLLTKAPQRQANIRENQGPSLGKI